MLAKEGSTNGRRLSIDGVLYWGILALTFVLPLFFIPLRGIASGAGKILLVEIFAAGMFLVWVGTQLKRRRLVVVRSRLGYSLPVFSVVVVVAALVSNDIGLAWLGENFSTSEGFFLASLGVLGFLTTQIFTTYARIITLYTSVFLSFLVVGGFQLLRFLFGSSALSFGVLVSDVTTLVGGWNDLGIYAGFILTVALVAIEFLKLKKIYRILLWVSVGFAVFCLLMVNTSLAWALVAIPAFLVFLYQAAFRDDNRRKRLRLPIVSLLVFIFALTGYFGLGNLAQNGLSLIRNIGYNEVRLSIGATANTVSDAWSRNIITGVGPNHFGYLWQEVRGEIAARLAFSDIRFQYGYSAVFTLLGTLGILGALSLLVIIGQILNTGIRKMFVAYTSKMERFFVVSAFVLVLYLWSVLIVYAPGPVLFTYAFLLTGAYAGLLAGQKSSPLLHLSLRGEKRYAISVLIAFLISVSLTLSVYHTSKKFVGLVTFRSAVYADSVQVGYNKALAAARIGKASSYYRSLSALTRDQARAAAAGGDIINDEAVRNQVEVLLGQSLTFANSATELNSQDYRNWLALGDTQSVLRDFDIEGAYLDARRAYENALLRNPKAHDVLARLANLEIAMQNYETAQTIVGTMILRRPDDIQALILAARIAYQTDSPDDGDVYLSQAVIAAGTNLNSLMRVGVMAYNETRYDLAREIFEYGLIQYPNSIDAALALAYAEDAVGNTTRADQIIEALVAAGVLVDSDATLPEELRSSPTDIEQIASDAAGDEIVIPEDEIAEPVVIDEQANGEEE